LLNEYEESQKTYTARIEALQERLQGEDQVKQNLEDLQKQLGEEMGGKKLLEQQLQLEIDRTKRLAQRKHFLRAKNKEESNEYSNRLKMLEEKLAAETEEKVKLESTPSLPQ